MVKIAYDNDGKNEKPEFLMVKSRIGIFEPRKNLNNLENPDNQGWLVFVSLVLVCLS